MFLAGWLVLSALNHLENSVNFTNSAADTCSSSALLQCIACVAWWVWSGAQTTKVGAVAASPLSSSPEKTAMLRRLAMPGLEITAGQRTMPGQNRALSEQIRGWPDMLSGHLGFQRKFNFETIMMEMYSILFYLFIYLFIFIMFPKKILTRGTFVCEIDDISCCQSRPFNVFNVRRLKLFVETKQHLLKCKCCTIKLKVTFC